MRQYEQDLAKRLYQARVRASQCAAEAPQPTASSPAPHLRSEGQTHGIVGVCWACFFLPSGLLLGLQRLVDSTSALTRRGYCQFIVAVLSKYNNVTSV